VPNKVHPTAFNIEHGNHVMQERSANSVEPLLVCGSNFESIGEARGARLTKGDGEKHVVRMHREAFTANVKTEGRWHGIAGHRIQRKRLVVDGGRVAVRREWSEYCGASKGWGQGILTKLH